MANEIRNKILIVEDDPGICTFLRAVLSSDGYDAIVVNSGSLALDMIASHCPDCILLDLGLPDTDGTRIIERVRQWSATPIVVISARSMEQDKAGALDLGADDYITKPFEGKELVARVKAVLRRSSPGESEKDTLSFPGLTISLEKYEVHYQGKLLEMPPKELEVLYFLAAHQNRVFTREQLLEQVWGFDFFGDSRTVDVHIKRLREKLQDSEALGWTIRTVWGVGYKFEVK